MQIPEGSGRHEGHNLTRGYFSCYETYNTQGTELFGDIIVIFE